ncbi:MAG: RNA polymerase sigma factor [Eubacteriales bacterium]
MEIETVNRLTAENMKTVFGFALSRLSDPKEAEILASDILYALLKSAPRLRDEGKFYAFMWRVAENTFVNYLRGKRPAETDVVDEAAADRNPVQDEVILREDLVLLRRELSLLSEEYRTATVLYYMEDKSCAAIAETLGTSVEMVKYYLFRARKILKEGMRMNRTFGEKSYNPKMFEIDFYGTHAGNDELYRVFRQRKILGNILEASYYMPVTMQEMSMELGVAAPYLEDEVDFLMDKHLLMKKNGRYQASIPIFTDECTGEIQEKIQPVLDDAAVRFAETFGSAFRKTYGKRFADENLLRWQAVMLCSTFALREHEKAVRDKYGDFPDDDVYSYLHGGRGRGIVWGRCSSLAGQPKDGEGIHGIYEGRSADGRGGVIAINFGQLRNAQNFTSKLLEPISCTGIGCFAYLPEDCKEHQRENGYVMNDQPNFAVYSPAEFDGLPELLDASVKIFREVLERNLDLAVRVTTEHAPEHIRRTARHTGAFVYEFTGVSGLVAALYGRGWLNPVDDMSKPALCVIDYTRETPRTVQRSEPAKAENGMNGIWIGENATVAITDELRMAYLRMADGRIASVLAHRDLGVVGVVYGQNEPYNTYSRVSPQKDHEGDTAVLDGDTLVYTMYDGQVFRLALAESMDVQMFDRHYEAGEDRTVAEKMAKWNVGQRFAYGEKNTLAMIDTEKYSILYDVGEDYIYCRVGQNGYCDKGWAMRSPICLRANECRMLRDNRDSMSDYHPMEECFRPDSCAFPPDGGWYWSVKEVTDDVIYLNGCGGAIYEIHRK